MVVTAGGFAGWVGGEGVAGSQHRHREREAAGCVRQVHAWLLACLGQKLVHGFYPALRHGHSCSGSRPFGVEHIDGGPTVHTPTARNRSAGAAAVKPRPPGDLLRFARAPGFQGGPGRC